MIASIDDHREAWEIEPICDVLPVAPSPTAPMPQSGLIPPSYRRARSRMRSGDRDQGRVFAENFDAYCTRKV
jgi:putative transposase